MSVNTPTDDDVEYVDLMPEGDAQNACQSFSGEVFTEYGIVDLLSKYPAERHEYAPEMHHPDDPQQIEQSLVVPFRVVQRGIKTLSHARTLAEKREEEEDGRYVAVLLSDRRGL